MFNVHHMTVRRGLAELEQQGVIEKRPRVGNFVKASKLSVAASRIAVLLHKWSSDRSPFRAIAGLTMAELDDAIDREKYSLTTLTYEPPPEALDRAAKLIIKNGIDGVLLYSSDSPSHLPAVRRLLDAGVKVVLIDHALTWDELGLFSVKYDEIGALRQIFERLVELGHRRIAVALDPGWHGAFHDFYRGCVETLFKKYQLGALDPMAVYPPWNPAACERDFACLVPLLDRRLPPTAIVVPDETFVTGMLRFSYPRHIRIPDDISLASAQDYSPHSHPISVSSPASDVLLRRGVRAAAEHLLALLAGKRPAEREISLRCDINWTNSVGPAPGSETKTSEVIAGSIIG